MESHNIPNSSLDSFIKHNKSKKSIKYNKDIKNILNMGIDDNVNESISDVEIAKKYGFKLKNVKTILNKSKDSRGIFLGEYSLNPYLGCSFDCEYCYINGSKYADSTNSFYIKVNALNILKNQLKTKLKSGKRDVLLIGSATDLYIDIEKELFLTRDILKLANRFKFPVHIVTKSDFILRDIDILKKINENAILPKDIANLRAKVMTTFSFSTTDDEIAKLFEPHAPSPKKRLESMKKLKKEGFLVGVSLMPILPYISDSEEAIEKMMIVFKDIGIDYIFGGSLSLFGETEESSKIKYFNILNEHFPDLLKLTEKLFKNKDYPPTKYQNTIYKRVYDISKKYDIENKIT